MGRRRQKNPLLGRIIGISVLAHVIALPILGYFGGFKKLQEHFVQTQMVMLPPPEIPKEKPIVKKETKTARPKTIARSKGKTTPNHGQPHAAHNNLPSPKLELAKGGGGGGAGDPGVLQGSGAAGVVPVDPNAGKGGSAKPDTPAPVVPEPVKPVVPAPTQPPVQAQVKPPDLPKTIVPVTPSAPKEAVFTAAAPLGDNQPKPTIPDDLRSDALDKTFVAEFTVGEDGAPMEVKAVQSTGNDELDRRALDAAKKWRFKPATRDGQPVVGKVRLFIEFQVS